MSETIPLVVLTPVLRGVRKPKNKVTTLLGVTDSYGVSYPTYGVSYTTRRSPPSLPSSSSPLTSLARPSTSHRVLPGHHRWLIVIFKGGRSKGNDFVIIAVLGSRAFRCFRKQLQKNSKRRSSRHGGSDSTWRDDRQILIRSSSVDGDRR